MNRIAKLGDVYCIRSERYDKWAVYKVVKEDNTKVALIALNWKKHGRKKIDISKTNLQKLILNENLRELLFSLNKSSLEAEASAYMNLFDKWCDF